MCELQDVKVISILETVFVKISICKKMLKKNNNGPLNLLFLITTKQKCNMLCQMNTYKVLNVAACCKYCGKKWIYQVNVFELIWNRNSNL